MKRHILCIALIGSLLSSCISIEKYWTGDNEFIVKKEVYWNTGEGSRKRKTLSSSRRNVFTKTYNAKGILLSYTKEKIKRYGCVGSTFYSLEKKYNPDGEIVSTTLWIDSTRTGTGKYIKTK